MIELAELLYSTVKNKVKNKKGGLHDWIYGLWQISGKRLN